MNNPPLFRKKYRVSSTRLPKWDYRSSGYYFVTWKVRANAKALGKIRNGLVRLSHLGKIIERELYNTMTIRPDINLDIFIIMPDHVHVLFDFWCKRNLIIKTETPQRASLRRKICYFQIL